MSEKDAWCKLIRIADDIFRYVEVLSYQQIRRGGGFSLEMPARVHAWRRPDVTRIFGKADSPLQGRYFADMHIGESRTASVPVADKKTGSPKQPQAMPGGSRPEMIRTVAATYSDLSVPRLIGDPTVTDPKAPIVLGLV